MSIERLDHYNVRTTDLDATVRFYTEALGLELGYRPPFPFPGAWIYIGGVPVVHVACSEPIGSTGSGRINHVAFFGRNIGSFRDRLTSMGLTFRERTVPDQSLQQIFIDDPNGVMVELNFEA
jgi:catechol 2,3-dioxygenase-like lactoylglutathione lyase family enzyme